MAHFGDFGDCCDFGCGLGTKVLSTFGAILHLLTHFCSVVFLQLFGMLAFSVFFEILSAPGSIFGTIWTNLLGPLAFEKSVESVKLSPFLEVLPLPNRGFLQTLTLDAFG